ncbi:hypothetical protein BC936DRAFT_146268 [Jimgerdemannia flammicorona]|uniref:Uncharacterized protein n=1 Tax=Jimgerdemannia flammicorona TaxID=994334 RepID=A0A433DLK6_9FUNG|nr:hypothetical protein BC936DRAFT_146268 [Jimgerdemannia flammicorona]
MVRKNHRRKNKDINQFWSGVEFDEQFIASPPSSSPPPPVTGTPITIDEVDEADTDAEDEDVAPTEDDSESEAQTQATKTRTGILRQHNILWFLSYHNPTPLEFFRWVQPTHRNRAFEVYKRCSRQAIEACEDLAQLKRLKELNKTADCDADWEHWLTEKKARTIRKEILSTNEDVHQELNTIVNGRYRSKARTPAKRKGNFSDTKDAEGQEEAKHEGREEEKKETGSDLQGREDLDEVLDNEEGFTTTESNTIYHMLEEEDSSSDEESAPEESNHVIYPTKESSNDVWELPSGRFAKDIIRTSPKDSHRYQ